MLHIETIEPATLELLKKIQSIPEFQGTRLVGGTALALQIGHRQSVDLDFFGIVPYDTTTLVQLLSELGNIIVLQDSPAIHIFLINGVKVDFVDFKFPWRQDPLEEDGVRLAQLEDIAAMKVTAAIGRGTKKDFIDIATLLQTYTLKQILDFYQSKYPNSSLFMATKSLLYFDDAEKDAMPRMFSSLTWEETKQIITDAVEKYT